MMHALTKRFCLWAALLMLLSPCLQAAPAPWYQWQSKRNGEIVCAQTTPGAGWQRGNIAFNNARCEGPGRR